MNKLLDITVLETSRVNLRVLFFILSACVVLIGHIHVIMNRYTTHSFGGLRLNDDKNLIGSDR